jgi:ATP-dependent helicase/nuclease subunit A
MTDHVSPLEQAKRAQREAADPAGSAWVSANAGSGKTRVLVDRVARLLLAGAQPHTILCLTFTKAAAAEMRGRLSQRLGGWTACADAVLAAELADLAGPAAAADPALLARARQLFALTLDAPGGMRVQTIHSFCESLLRRFPAEARIGVDFAVADDIETAALLAGARDRLLAGTAEDALARDALEDLVLRADAAGIDTLLTTLAGDRRRLRRLLAAHGGDPERAIAALAASLEVDPAMREDALEAAFVAAMPLATMREAADSLARGKVTDQNRARALAECLAAPEPRAALEPWLSVFLTKQGDVRKQLATKDVQKASPTLLPALQAEAERCLGFVQGQLKLRQFRVSAAVTRLGTRLVAHYEAAKRARALLDYDDLIFRALALLEDEDAAWVRYRLDGGIDHILVDEAQDTSEEQWRLVELLTEEFFAGEGAAGDRPRTLFAVGDEKQSIFSFQGADREAFGRARAGFAARVAAAGRRFSAVELAYSFRSTPAVLDVVDRLFAHAAARAGVAAEPTRHAAIRTGDIGLFELWPLVEPPDAGAETAWDAPLDYVAETAPRAVLAERIAGMVRGWLDCGEALAPGGRAIRAGDVLILVRRRNGFFVEMVRALKACGVPVAGADRLVLAAHMAVQDLLSLGEFALLPRDDYALACLLKSPLCGLGDDDLIRLCPRREGSLWATLRARAGEDPRWSAAAADLARWLALAERVPPFEFFARVLGADGGRARVLARLGAEANDPLDEFLALALAFEREHVPSLQGFLHWFDRGGAEVKRDMEQGRDEVRVMTVHAAKGLEAPIVFLPDTLSPPAGRHDPKLFWPEAPHGAAAPVLILPGGSANDTALSAAARQAARLARMEEYRRLLYVATTRPRDRLYVCGWAERALPDPEAAAEDAADQGEAGQGEADQGEATWHALLDAALRGKPGVREVDLPWGGPKALRLGPVDDAGVAAGLGVAATAPATPGAAPLPGWALAPAPAEPPPPAALSPSSIGVAQSQAGEGPATQSDAARRGTLLHRLFELLPAMASGQRAEGARRIVARAVPELPLPEREALAAEAMAVLDAFPELFGPEARAEVPVIGTVAGHAVAGQIDRLVIRPDEILIVDFKSNRAPPGAAEDVSTAYAAQLALYRALLAPLYPGRVLRCRLIWTATASATDLPAALLDAALAALGPGSRLA